MADAKITELSAIGTLASGDLFPVVDDPSGTPVTKSATIDNIRSYILGLANTFTATQTITPAANTSALVASGFSLTGSNAQSILSLSGTLNTTGAPNLIDLQVTDTASSTSTMLMRLRVGSSNILTVRKDGSCELSDVLVVSSGGVGLTPIVLRSTAINGICIGAALNYGWSSTSSAFVAPEFALFRDAAHTMAQRGKTNAQTFRVYGTFTDASNHRRLAMTMSTSGVAEIKPEGAGSGSSGNVLHISGLPTSNPGPGILWNNAGTPAIGT